MYFNIIKNSCTLVSTLKSIHIEGAGLS